MTYITTFIILALAGLITYYIVDYRHKGNSLLDLLGHCLGVIFGLWIVLCMLSVIALVLCSPIIVYYLL